jgi:membrane protease YdiL (CAAX protease family)
MISGEVPDRRRRDLLELCIGYALILIVIWTPRPWQRILYTAAAVFLIAVLWASLEGWKAMGLHRTNLARSLWVVSVALAMTSIALVIAGRLHTLQPFAGMLAFVKRYWGYSLWAFAQQVLLQDFFFLRLLRLIPKPTYAALAAAVIFSVAHLPNPILTVVTFVWGFAACLLFLHYRNLYPLALAHAIFGIAIAITLPGPVTRNMRVGLGYLTYPAHHFHQSSKTPVTPMGEGFGYSRQVI